MLITDVDINTSAIVNYTNRRIGYGVQITYADNTFCILLDRYVDKTTKHLEDYFVPDFVGTDPISWLYTFLGL